MGVVWSRGVKDSQRKAEILIVFDQIARNRRQTKWTNCSYEGLCTCGRILLDPIR